MTQRIHWRSDLPAALIEAKRSKVPIVLEFHLEG
jgi:hypothetical protein